MASWAPIRRRGRHLNYQAAIHQPQIQYRWQQALSNLPSRNEGEQIVRTSFTAEALHCPLFAYQICSKAACTAWIGKHSTWFTIIPSDDTQSHLFPDDSCSCSNYKYRYFLSVYSRKWLLISTNEFLFSGLVDGHSHIFSCMTCH